VPLAEALRRSLAGEDVEFLKASATGRFSSSNLYKQATYGGGPGWQVLTLFTSDDGIAVLVDRGKIAAALRDRLPPPAALMVTGAIRAHDRGQGFFDPENDSAEGSWYWWDVPAMLGSQSIPAETQVAPFILQALPDAGSPPPPEAEDLAAGIPNNHLNYALTWFALALCLAAIAGLLARREIASRQA
jgi:surfeit locus 1 family protein